ncbi:MAG: S-layer homology domain-containing protein, partial [Ruminiclostridium sp.]|nr:S-layer homology domain-containing protein [Ruminiclostridium sp.]
WPGYDPGGNDKPYWPGYDPSETFADPCSTFGDIGHDAWYHDAVSFVAAKGLMNGVDPLNFAPGASLSRGMLVTVLWRDAGEPLAHTDMPFTDVPEGTWYTEAVRWAASVGIVKGYGDGTFGITDDITREQLAAMLYRYERLFNDNGITDIGSFPLNFPDGGAVSAWADEAVKWAVKEGIMNGKGDGTLDPQGIATRAETAQMLMNYLK